LDSIYPPGVAGYHYGILYLLDRQAINAHQAQRRFEPIVTAD
jgi:hypothetical protein